jgi:hypothetical protein
MSPRGRRAAGTCPWPGCSKPTRASYLMCRTHWYALPFEIRERILATFRPGQTALTASSEYLEALRDALHYAQRAAGGEDR